MLAWVCPRILPITGRPRPAAAPIAAYECRLCRARHKRHAFAVLRLLTWYESGADLRVKLPLLATYLGHIGLTSSQVYLHMTEDFVGELTRRQLDQFGDIITEVAQ